MGPGVTATESAGGIFRRMQLAKPARIRQNVQSGSLRSRVTHGKVGRTERTEP